MISNIFPCKILATLCDTWKTDIYAAIEATEAVKTQARVLFSLRPTLVVLWAAQGAWPALGWGRGAGHSWTRPGIGQLTVNTSKFKFTSMFSSLIKLTSWL